MAKVFISYSKRDYIGDDGIVIRDNVVDKIIKSLSEHGIDFWIDREKLDPGETYATIIANSISDCDVFLFLSSRNANSSPWTLREISMAIDSGKTVLPVRLDHSKYAQPVSLYLASIQYIDWLELGEQESLNRIVVRIQGLEQDDEMRRFDKRKRPLATSGVIYAGIAFLTFIYAVLTYQFLWARSLRSDEIMGGLVGYACEFGVLMSIWYLVRLLRFRKSTFIFPAIVSVIVLLFGMLMNDSDIIWCSIMLLFGWILVVIMCAIGGKRRKSFFKQMSKEQILARATDPENLIFLYLLFKAIIIVWAHYRRLSAGY